MENLRHRNSTDTLSCVGDSNKHTRQSKNHIYGLDHRYLPVDLMSHDTLYSALAIIFLLVSCLTPMPGPQEFNRGLGDADTSKLERYAPAIKGWFTGNKGQVENSEVRFFYTASDCTFGFVESGYLLKILGKDNITSVVRVSFEGSNPVIPKGLGELPHRSNYFFGNDSSKWRTGVPNYANVVYQELYDGIDLVFYTSEKGLKYDFIVSPRAEPKEILYSYDGADTIHIDDQGDLHLTTPSGKLVEEAPFSFQIENGKKVVVSSHYRVDGKKVGFEIGNYDLRATLVIDPLIYSTYVGGSGADISESIALDSENNVYVTGRTGSSDFPTTPGCFNDSYNGGELFVFKLNSNGSDLVYSTFVGGSGFGGDISESIAVDSDMNVYVTGHTSHSDFPTTPGCFDDSYEDNGDVFVFKLNSDGSDLIYSTYVGGGGMDDGNSIIVDSENNAYIAGATSSSDFPTTNGSYNESHSGANDVFILKLNQDGSDLIYSTYVGGCGGDGGGSIVLDSANNAYITGSTSSSDFPTTSGCFNESHSGAHDVFVVKLNQDGSDLIYSTYIGGNDSDVGREIVVDNMNNAYVVGETESSNFPNTSNCFDDSLDGERDVFVFKLNSDGSDLIYSTYIGGNEETFGDFGSGIAVDSENNAYITGSTDSCDFPTTTGCFDETIEGESDVFVCKVNQDGSNLMYSTFVGGGSGDDGEDIKVDCENNAYITGYTATWSTSFPTTPGCYDNSSNGDRDIFVFKLNPGRPIAMIDSISPNPANESETVCFQGNGTDDGTIEAYWWNSSIDDFLSSEKSFSLSHLSNGTHTIYFKVKDNNGTWSREVNTTLTINGIPRANIDEILPNPAIRKVRIEFLGHATDDGNITRYVWSSNISGEIYDGTEAEFNCSNLKIGTHTITLKVQDNYDIWSDEVNITLIIHEKPVANILSISPSPSLDNEGVYFVGNGTDDGEVVCYLWTSSLDNELYNGTEANFSTSDLSVGNHTITLKVQDNYDVWSDMVSTNVTVYKYIPPNKIPTVIITSPENGSVVKGKIIINGTASDEDGTIEMVELSINGGEWIAVTGTANWSFEWDTIKVKNGDSKIKVRAFDGKNYSNELVWNVKVENEKDGGGGFLLGLAAVLLGIIIAGAIVANKKRKD